MKNNLDELVNVITKKVVNRITETSRRQKAQQAIQGKNRRVKTIAIISAQNPMGSDGSDLPKDYNQKSHEELLKNLKIGQYRYFVVSGKYGTSEISVIVYNISLDETLKLCYHFNQESVIFVDITNGEDVSYQYWEGEDHQSPLKKKYEEHEIINATDDADFYTKISKKFKFRIPFFEDIKKYISDLDKLNEKYDVDRLISECIDAGWSGKHRYYCRGKLHSRKG